MLLNLLLQTVCCFPDILQDLIQYGARLILS